MTATATKTTPTPDRGPGYLARTIGALLMAHRLGLGKSQRAQARELGIAGNTLRELELGEANATLGRVEDVATKLGLTVEVKLRKARR